MIDDQMSEAHRMEQAAMTINEYLVHLGPVINDRFQGISSEGIATLALACAVDYHTSKICSELQNIRGALESIDLTLDR